MMTKQEKIDGLLVKNTQLQNEVEMLEDSLFNARAEKTYLVKEALKEISRVLGSFKEESVYNTRYNNQNKEVFVLTVPQITYEIGKLHSNKSDLEALINLRVAQILEERKNNEGEF